MEQTAKKIDPIRFCTNEVINAHIQKGGVKVSASTLQAETLWPGKLGAEIAITKLKYPKITQYDVVSDQRLYLVWEDGSTYGIPSGNVKGMVYE